MDRKAKNQNSRNRKPFIDKLFPYIVLLLLIGNFIIVFRLVEVLIAILVIQAV